MIRGLFCVGVLLFPSVGFCQRPICSHDSQVAIELQPTLEAYFIAIYGEPDGQIPSAGSLPGVPSDGRICQKFRYDERVIFCQQNNAQNTLLKAMEEISGAEWSIARILKTRLSNLHSNPATAQAIKERSIREVEELRAWYEAQFSAAKPRLEQAEAAYSQLMAQMEKSNCHLGRTNPWERNPAIP